jgi:hypothetical protein
MPNLSFDIGDGSDGVFDATTYAHFSMGGDVSGNKIRLDLSAHPQLQVTSFTLEAGWILEPVGTAALVIKSQSDVNIQGEIWCHGDAGGNGSGATPGSGGQGRCGGGNGGDGGAVSGSAQNGGDASASVTGGHGGNFISGTVVSGGGGGSRNCGGDPTCASVLIDGTNSNASGGQGGTSSDDPYFSVTGGGAGGGGGAGTATDAGAGGGGGGGSVLIYSGRDVNLGTSPTSVTGFIRAYGGDGGSPSTTAGAGGGGGGGSVQVFAARTVNIYNSNAAASSAIQGGFGTNSSAETGGNGDSGRSWITSINYNGIGSYTPGEETPLNTGNFVEYNTATEYVVSKVYDLGGSIVDVTAATLSPTSTDFGIQYRGSNDAFASDDTGWSSDVRVVANKRYIRYRVAITTSNATAPTFLDSLSLTYTPGMQTDFAFKTAGCGRVHDASSGPCLALCALILGVFFAGLRSRSPKRQSPRSEWFP